MIPWFLHCVHLIPAPVDSAIHLLNNWGQVIILLILKTLFLDYVLILLGEDWLWSLLGLKWLKRCQKTYSTIWKRWFPTMS